MCNLKFLRPKQAGFTLLEILLAMFIFTIVSMIVVGALHNVITTQSSVEAHAKRLAALQTALTILSRDLEQAVNRPITTPNGGLENAFVGTEKTVTFTHAGLTNPMGQLQRSTLQRVRYRLANNQLIRDTWSQLDLTPQSKEQRRVLLNGIESLAFQYLDQKGNFHNRWPPPSDQGNLASLPRAVKVLVTFKELGKINQLYVIPGETLEQQPN